MVDFFLGDTIQVPLEGELTNFAELTRGTTQTFRVVVQGDLDSELESTGATASGDTGGTASGTSGFTASGSLRLQTADERYERIIELLEHAGGNISGTTFKGIPWFREFLPSSAPETLVQPLYPTDELEKNGVPGIWGLIVGGDDATTIQGSQGEINIDIFVLAPIDSFTTTTDVKAEFEVNP